MRPPQLARPWNGPGLGACCRGSWFLLEDSPPDRHGKTQDIQVFFKEKGCGLPAGGKGVRRRFHGLPTHFPFSTAGVLALADPCTGTVLRPGNVLSPIFISAFSSPPQTPSALRPRSG